MQLIFKGKVHLGWVSPAPVTCLVLSAALCSPKHAMDAALVSFAFKDAKSDGNSEFEEGDFVAPLHFYNLALDVLGDSEDTIKDRCVLQSNKSQAYIKLLDGAKALESAEAALRLDPTHAKSLARKDAANELIQKHRKPLSEFKTDENVTVSVIPLERWQGPCWHGLVDFFGATPAADYSNDSIALRLWEHAKVSRGRWLQK